MCFLSFSNGWLKCQMGNVFNKGSGCTGRHERSEMTSLRVVI